MCYTRRGTIYNVGMEQGMRELLMINREDLAKLICIRDSSPAFWLQGPPFAPLTLDLFSDVGLRIRRVSYLYTILRKCAESAYVASAIHPPTVMEV